MLRRLAAVLLVAAAVSTAVASASAAEVAFTPGPDAAQRIPAARLTSIADAIAAKLIVDPDRSVLPAFMLGDQYVPSGTLAIEPQAPQVNATYIAVPMQLVVDGRVARTVVAGFRVQQYIHTAVTTHDLVPGAVLTADDLTLARVVANGRPAVPIEALVGRQLRSGTVRGSALFVEQTSVDQIVKAGAATLLIIHDGPVQLTADVIARTGGGMGEAVTVYNQRTSKLISGIVTGPDRVELVLPGADE